MDTNKIADYIVGMEYNNRFNEIVYLLDSLLKYKGEKEFYNIYSEIIEDD